MNAGRVSSIVDTVDRNPRSVNLDERAGLSDRDETVRNNMAYVFATVVEVNPEKVAQYLDALEP